MENKQEPPREAESPFQTCGVCGRTQPFTLAILAAIPLGGICTCALEIRLHERRDRQSGTRSSHTQGGTHLR